MVVLQYFTLPHYVSPSIKKIHKIHRLPHKLYFVMCKYFMYPHIFYMCLVNLIECAHIFFYIVRTFCACAHISMLIPQTFSIALEIYSPHKHIFECTIFFLFIPNFFNVSCMDFWVPSFLGMLACCYYVIDPL